MIVFVLVLMSIVAVLLLMIMQEKIVSMVMYQGIFFHNVDLNYFFQLDHNFLVSKLRKCSMSKDFHPPMKTL